MQECYELRIGELERKLGLSEAQSRHIVTEGSSELEASALRLEKVESAARDHMNQFKAELTQHC